MCIGCRGAGEFSSPNSIIQRTNGHVSPMPSSTRLKVTPHIATAVIGVCVGLLGIFVVAPVVAHVVAKVLVYGAIPGLIAPSVPPLK